MPRWVRVGASGVSALSHAASAHATRCDTRRAVRVRGRLDRSRAVAVGGSLRALVCTSPGQVAMSIRVPSSRCLAAAPRSLTCSFPSLLSLSLGTRSKLHACGPVRGSPGKAFFITPPRCRRQLMLPIASCGVGLIQSLRILPSLPILRPRRILAAGHSRNWC